jgi:hypothetical protein
MTITLLCNQGCGRPAMAAPRAGKCVVCFVREMHQVVEEAKAARDA